MTKRFAEENKAQFYKNVFAAAERSWLMMMMLHNNKVLNR